jgi:hypothetical protein
VKLYLEIAIASILAVLIVGGVQQYRVMSCENRVSKQETKVAKLGNAIDTQNHAAETLAAAGALDSGTAAARATDVLLAGERQKTNQPKGAGPKAMNEFMRGLFQ